MGEPGRGLPFPRSPVLPFPIQGREALMAGVIWGRNAVYEALVAGRPLERILLASGARRGGRLDEVLEQARRHGVPVREVERDVLDRLARGAQHQGVLAEAAQPFRYTPLPDLLGRLTRLSEGELPVVIVADSVQDPQNLGSLIRSAEALGCHGVIVGKHRAVGVTPTVAKASAGAVEHIPIVQVTNVAQALEVLKEAGLWTAAIEADGETEYDRADFNVPLCIVAGSEGKGLGRLVRERCDYAVRIPLRGKVSSLNVAVATAVVLSEVWRQRRVKEGQEAKRGKGEG